MTDTPRLSMPLLAASQAQKHVTHNEALEILDATVQMTVQAFGAASPPGSPVEGQIWALGSAPGGVWVGQGGRLAAWYNGGWLFVTPGQGWVAAGPEGGLRQWDGSAWVPLPLAVGAWGAATRAIVLTEEVGPLSGASVDSAIAIPDRAVVLAVSTRTVVAVTGASSYDCGIASDPDKFGGSLGAAAGSANVGVIGPQAFYADTPVRLTAVGGAFTGGTVRVAIHILTFTEPAI